MSYDQDELLKAMHDVNGMKRLAAVLSTLTLAEIETFAGEISEGLEKLIYRDDRAIMERVQVLVSGIARYAADPSLRKSD